MVIRRRVLHDKETGEPQEVGASYMLASIVGGTYLEQPTVVPQALFLCVEEISGKTYAYARDQWVARLPTQAEADTLQISSSTGVIHLIHVARAEDATLLEVSESVWPADRVEIIDEYSVSQEAEDVDGLSDI